MLRSPRQASSRLPRGLRVCLLVTTLRLLAAQTAGEDSNQPKPRSIFNMGQFDLGWVGEIVQKNVLEPIFDKDAKTASRAAYARAGNVAKYLGVSSVNAIVVSIPVNFIFLGFRNDGNLDLNLDSEELQRWFMYVDHYIPKTRIVDPHFQDEFEDSEEYAANRRLEWTASQSNRSHDMPVPTESRVFYNISCSVLDVGPRVTELFERAVRLMARPLDPSKPSREGNKQQVFQIDTRALSVLIENFMAELKLNDAYTIFIANPKRSPDAPFYGYRQGLSQQELQLILKNATFTQELLRSFPGLPPEIPDTAAPAVHRLNSRNEKFSERRMWAEAEAWVKEQEASFDHTEQLKMKGHPIQSLVSIATRTLQGMYGARAANNLRSILSGLSPVGSSCLADLFVGRERYAWIDLTAGPFSWGPMNGDSGARTHFSLPKVEHVYKHAKPEELTAWDSSDQFEEILSEMALARFETVDEEKHEHLVLEAELDVYEAFARKHCQDRSFPPALCFEIQDRVSDMIDLLEKLSKTHPQHSKDQVDRIALMHEYNIFGDDKGLRNITLAHDEFLSQLGAVTSKIFRHAIVPSTAAGNYRFHKHIAFHLYVISKPGIEERFGYKPTGINAFSVKDFKYELLSLGLSTQAVSFSEHYINIGEDPNLAAAYSAALRAATISADRFDLRTRLYLDSTLLHEQLRHINSAKEASRVFEVPIFLFATDLPELYIDKYYLAKSLPDMIVVVQSLKSEVSDRFLVCDGKPNTLDLRAPLKAAISATMEHLGGVLQSHHAFNGMTHHRAQDWLLGMGPSALAGLGQEYNVPRMHADTLHRNYIVSSIDACASKYNKAVELLAQQPTDAGSFREAKNMPFLTFLSRHQKFMFALRNVVRQLEMLDFSASTAMLAEMEALAAKIYEDAEAIVNGLHPAHCLKRRRLPLGWIPVVLFASMSMLLLFVLLLGPRSRKPKIN